jgi:hypothetical protein
MPVGDDRPLDPAGRVHMEATGRAAEARAVGLEPVFEWDGGRQWSVRSDEDVERSK